MKKYVVKIIDLNKKTYKHFETNYILEAEDIVRKDGKKYEVIFREIVDLNDVK